MENLLEAITALCKRRGFVYPTSEIYGGLLSSYDYGPLGVELLQNLKQLWWREFIHKRDDMLGLDSQILLHPQTWVASGHVGSFADPMVEDTKTHKRYRADHLIESWIKNHPSDEFEDFKIEDLKIDDMAEFIKLHKLKSPEGNEITAPKKFNLLFETKLGVVEDNRSLLYLRGETAQGIFTNFKNILDSTRVKLPFGVGQIGKSFRNEITSGQFIFRTLEFEQAEIEYFFYPKDSNWSELFDSWKKAMWDFVCLLGIDEKKLRWRRHTDMERSHYSKETFDLEYHFPFGWKELWGIAYRTDYDLLQHQKYSGKKLEYLNQITGESIIPHVIEPAVGLNRLVLMILCDSYLKENKRIVLKLDPMLSPTKVAVFPLVANKPDILNKARDTFNLLKRANIKTAWDDRGNIGKRYLSQDEAGTPWCVTIDYDTMTDGSVTVRDRDTTKQERLTIGNLPAYFLEKLYLS